MWNSRAANASGGEAGCPALLAIQIRAFMAAFMTERAWGWRPGGLGLLHPAKCRRKGDRILRGVHAYTR